MPHILGQRGMQSAYHLVSRTPIRKDVEPSEVDPVVLTRKMKDRAKEIGISAVGVAMYDPKYAFAPFLGKPDGDRVVVCVLEQNWAATQTIPSVLGERAALNTYSRLVPMANQLADFIRDLGYTARAGDGTGRVATIAFAVEAGLGQLGLNGQLLTPFAGSRCRLAAITTDAPLAPDSPVDYGVPGLCDACKVCVRRCPSGAITSKREMHRGVYKAKIKTERCSPMMGAADGCGVCMKVCPVQRYGLPAVIQEFAKSGRVLGKDTDELEGYTWPVDGRHYGPGEKPKEAVNDELLRPHDFHFDPTRRLPVVQVAMAGDPRALSD
jgi:ferredoxin